MPRNVIVKMQTEDYIFQDDISFKKYPLSRNHSIAIGVTALLACSLYFVMPQNKITTTTSFYGAMVPDESSYDDFLDPTRSLTDLLLNSDGGEIPASSDEVRFSANNNNQRVYRSVSSGSMENYDEDVGVELEYSDEAVLDEELEVLAGNSVATSENISAAKANNPAFNGIDQWLSEEVQRGDTLSSIFSDLNVPYAVLLDLSNNENKEAGKALTNLRPGNKLYFHFDRNNNLLGFVQQINSNEQWHFSRASADQDFVAVREQSRAHLNENTEVKEALGAAHVEKPALVAKADAKDKAKPDSKANAKAEQEVKSAQVAQANLEIKVIPPTIKVAKEPAYKTRGRLVVAEIKKGDSFSNAAHRAGLTYAEIKQITNLFKGRVQFTRHIQPGDKIRVLFSQAKGEGRINAIELKTRKTGTLAVYRNEVDGKYYDERGYNTRVSTFRRFPINGKVVISSSFNPSRRHPVTGRVRPHNGTDFAVRIGTPVLTPADGVVEIAKYSRSAGYYVVIRHRGSYSSVYMHLSKLLVKSGDRVRIGQTIARSGNTGISTGPHLHYELRHNNKPINAMRVSLPTNDDPVATKNRKRFEKNVALFKKQLHQDSLIAQNN